jgi:hypothetical protein
VFSRLALRGSWPADSCRTAGVCGDFCGVFDLLDEAIGAVGEFGDGNYFERGFSGFVGSSKQSTPCWNPVCNNETCIPTWRAKVSPGHAAFPQIGRFETRP